MQTSQFSKTSHRASERGCEHTARHRHSQPSQNTPCARRVHQSRHRVQPTRSVGSTSISGKQSSTLLRQCRSTLSVSLSRVVKQPYAFCRSAALLLTSPPPLASSAHVLVKPRIDLSYTASHVAYAQLAMHCPSSRHPENTRDFHPSSRPLRPLRSGCR